jgi:hypothetical protein
MIQLSLQSRIHTVTNISYPKQRQQASLNQITCNMERLNTKQVIENESFSQSVDQIITSHIIIVHFELHSNEQHKA